MSSMSIMLKDILPIENISDYKVHFVRITRPMRL